LTKKPDSAEFPELDPRARQVLGAVIREYIATAEPVAEAASAEPAEVTDK